ncbi:hypothetical protein AMR41_05360 [Hapalosiphon sp. MRB220]|nr:hypothetical protein AMR41_05360 [Hapalosiphon sp. MRB220]
MIPFSDLLVDLSEKEQEIATGGRSSSLYDFVIKKTDIVTFANNENNFSDGGNNISSKQQTGYALSEVTFGFNFKALRGRKYGLSGLELLRRLILYLFT